MYDDPYALLVSDWLQPQTMERCISNRHDKKVNSINSICLVLLKVSV